MKVVRASSLPLIYDCRASHKMSVGRPSVCSPEMRLGTAVHALAELGPDPSDSEVEAVLIANLPDPEDRANAKSLWMALPELPHGVLREHKVAVSLPSGNVLTCTMDAFHRQGRTAMVWDYKTGMGHVASPKNNPQMWAYAVAAAVECDWEVDAVEVTMPQPAKGRDGYTYRFGIEDVETFEKAIDALVRDAVRAEPDFTPGDHCARCRGRETCKALSDLLAPIVAMSDLDVPKAIGELSMVQLGDVYLKASMLATLAEAAKKAASSELRRRDVTGVILPNGKRLVQVKRSNESIDVVTAWPVLVEELGANMSQAVKITKSGIESAAGSKAKAKDIVRRLADIGAVSVTESKFYQCRKGTESEEGSNDN